MAADNGFSKGVGIGLGLPFGCLLAYALIGCLVIAGIGGCALVLFGVAGSGHRDAPQTEQIPAPGAKGAVSQLSSEAWEDPYVGCTAYIDCTGEVCVTEADADRLLNGDVDTFEKRAARMVRAGKAFVVPQWAQVTVIAMSRDLSRVSVKTGAARGKTGWTPTCLLKPSKP